MAAKFMFLSYQKPSCKLYFSRTRALKNKAVLGLAKKNPGDKHSTRFFG